jgi:uncharacterized protein
MIKNWLASQNNKDNANVLASSKMVKCDYCKTHLPQDQALGDNGRWFCHQEHKKLFGDK